MDCDGIETHRTGRDFSGTVCGKRGPSGNSRELRKDTMAKMSDPDYRAIDAVNYSGLKLFADSPLHYWHRYRNPDYVAPEQSKAFRMGSAIHCRTLEGLQEYSRRYAREAKFDKRTKDGKAGHAAWLESVGDAEVIPADEWDLVEEISASVLKSPMASALLEGVNGSSEEVVQAIDEETGLMLKGKCDRIQTVDSKTYIVDLKTCSQMYGGAGPDGVGKSVARFKYHWQAAFYTDLLNASGEFGEVAGFLFVFVEKEAPHAVGIYEASDQMVQAGREQYRVALRDFKKAAETDNWPGYDDRIVSLELPRWAL